MRFYTKVTCFFLIVFSSMLSAQEYDVLSHHLNTSVINGVKIKTNLPFTNSSQMITLDINGYNYVTASSIGLTINYYIYAGSFVNFSISSYGAYAPAIYLSNEGGKVVVFIDDKPYYQRFKAKVFAKGMSEQATWFQGWIVLDELLNGTQTVKLPYTNRLGNLYGENVFLTGKIGIGTNNPTEKLAVNGNIRAKEIKVEASNWPDYVFKPDYTLMPLKEVEQHIKTHGHLPDIPKATQIEEDGLSLGEMNKLMMKKNEELTLHMIEKEKEIHELKSLRKEVEQLQKLIIIKQK